MDSLIDNFDKYYPKNEQIVKDDWIRDPFLARDLPAHFDHKENEELIDLITDVSLQATFTKRNSLTLGCVEKQRVQYYRKSIKVYNAISHFLSL